jgi:hypothetical protein
LEYYKYFCGDGPALSAIWDKHLEGLYDLYENWKEARELDVNTARTTEEEEEAKAVNLYPTADEFLNIRNGESEPTYSSDDGGKYYLTYSHNLTQLVDKAIEEVERLEDCPEGDRDEIESETYDSFKENLQEYIDIAKNSPVNYVQPREGA